ncbi:MAG: LON peptidase substrate-binding domain-containing protein [Betaproteobacteria bacterium]
MSDLLSLFPLPTVVLFPNVFLPLHVFEPRYRELVADVLAADRVIGIVLLKPGWQSDYEGRPPVYPIGCSGLITHVERLPDGRFNLVLRGLERFRILDENHDRAYRRASVLSLGEELVTPEDRAAIRQHRARLESLIAPPDDRAGDPKIPVSMPDQELVNALSQYLDFEPMEKQALLEQPTLRARARSLVELIEIKTMMARGPRVPNLAH